LECNPIHRSTKLNRDFILQNK